MKKYNLTLYLRQLKNISVTYGCRWLIDNCRFLSTGLDDLVKTLDDDDFEVPKKSFQINQRIWKKN